MKKKDQELEKKRRLILLKKLIDRANILPSWYTVSEIQGNDFDDIHISLYENMKKIEEDLIFQGTKTGEIKNRTERDLNNIKTRTEKFRQYVLNGFDVEITLGMWDLEYGDEFENYANLLYGAKIRYDSLLFIREQLQRITKFELSQSRNNYFPPSKGGSLILDREGIFRFEIDDLTEALIGTNIDKIKECVICKKIIYLHRLDKKCCSLICRNIYNVRLKRGKEKSKGERHKEEIIREKYTKAKIRKG